MPEMSSPDMRVELIDERDAVSEDCSPRYRVVFEDAGSAATYRLTGASFRDAWGWARQQGAGRRYTVWVEHVLPGEPGMVALALIERSDGEPTA
jgi:hypothetical protein